MGKSRRKKGYGYEDSVPREYGRSRGRERSGAGTVIIIIVAVLLMLAAAFLYLRKDAAFADILKLPFTFGSTEAPSTVAILNTESSADGTEVPITANENDAVIPEKETTSAEIQNITVAVPTTVAETEAETEPETLPPPKYTENENTRLISRFSNPSAMDTQPEGDSAATLKSEALKNTVTVTFAGDILFDDRYAIMASAISRTKGKPTVDDMFDEETLSVMRGSDIFMVNNEFPYSDGGSPLQNKKYTFRAKPEYATLLADMGADIVALANNHMYDYGEAALLDTLSTLKNAGSSSGEAVDGSSISNTAGIPYVGAGTNIDEAAAPFYFTTGEIKIGFIAATQIERMGNPDTKGATDTTPGVFRCLDSKKLCEVITNMHNECDFVVAYLHWGTESTTNVDEHQKKLAIAVRDAGADLIIGDHPHVLQGISALDSLTEGGVKVPCIYSLGNYLFNSNSQDTCLVTAYIDQETAELVAFQFIPARQEGCRTHSLSGTEKERVLKHMRSLSKADIDEDGFVNLK